MPPLIAPLRTHISPGATGAVVAVLVIVATGMLLWRREGLRGTTLVIPWVWSLLAVWCVALPELLQALLFPTALGSRLLSLGSLEFLRQVGAAATICPLMALLGAKRPQDRGWQLIVVSLWAVLCLPSAQAALFVARNPLWETIWSCFLAVFVAVGLVNHLPTRHWAAALCFCAAQIALLAPRLPLLAAWQSESLPLPGLVLVCAGIATVQFRAARRGPPGWDLVWLDFRDRFGLLWGLRLAERINSTARMQGWNLYLSWSGFRAEEPESGSPPAQELELIEYLPPATDKSFRMLLRRFVSQQWIRNRLPVPDATQTRSP